MKSMITKRIVAAACALMLTAGSSAAVFANDNADAGNQPGANQSQQEMMNEKAPKGEKPDGEPKDQMPEAQAPSEDQNAPQGEKPDGEPKDQMPEAQAPSEDQNAPQGEKPDGEPLDEMPEQPDGEAPAEGGGMQDLFKKVSELVSGTAQESVTSLLEQYKSAVDAERESTDETEKFTAAGLVKDLMDAINAALEAAGVDFRVSVPTDKPEAKTK